MLGNLPDDLHGPLGIYNVECIEAAFEVVLERLCQGLDHLCWHFGHADALEIYYGYPVLDLARDESAGNHVLGHVSRHVSEGFMVSLHSFEFVHVYIANRSHFSIASENIGVAFV